MKMQPVLLVLTLVNLALLTWTLVQFRPAVAAPDTAPVLRGRALQIVDERGNMRASIAVYPASTPPNGVPTAETVMLKLITERGRPSVKIGASEEQAAMALVGPSGTQHTYIHMGAHGSVSALTLKNEDGRERAVTP
jgi:hypothetical protein